MTYLRVSRAIRDRTEDRQLEPLGKAIRAARGDQISQEGLADASGIERAHMGKIERGKVNVSFLNLLKIAKALNTDLSEIIKRAGY